MPAKNALAAPFKSPVVRVLGAVLAIAVVGFLLLQQASFLLARSLRVAFGSQTESTFRSAWFEWDGDLVAQDLVAHPSGPQDQASIRFERLHLETPGWFWFLRNAFDRKLSTAHLDRIHLTLEGGEVDVGVDPTLGDLGPFGAVSASPFEAEGCLADASFPRDALLEMGLKPEPTRLEFDYHANGSLLDTRIVLETRRASRVQLDRRERLPGAVNVLLLGAAGGEVLSERWEVQDQGFVSARNRFCAKKDGTDARRFIDRHVDSVERLLATRGFGLGAEARIAYRRFARDGGTLVFGGEYKPPVPVEELYELRANGEALARMAPLLNYNGRAYPVQWLRFTPRPLPGLDDGEPTFARFQRERAAPSASEGETAATLAGDAAVAPPDSLPPATAVADAASSAPIPTVAVPVETASTPAATSATVVATSAEDESTSAAVPAPAAPASSQPAASLEPPVTAAPATAAAASDTPETTPPADTAAAAQAAAAAVDAPASEPQAARAPATAAKPPLDPAIAARIKAPSSGPAPAAAAGGPKPGATLAWDKLAGLRGRTVRIWTVHAPPRTVEIVQAEGDSLRVAARLGGGNAEFTIQRQGFLRATLIR